MPDEHPTVAGRRRLRSVAATTRAEALERLKALRRVGRREMGAGGFEIKMEEPIYDIVNDDQYEALVAKRREEAKGFIIDDSGMGYGDEGQEEDWSLAGVALSSEESERPKRRKNNSNLAKAKEAVTKPSAFPSAAALMGNQSISNIFTSKVFKKDKQKSFSCDSMVDDVIAEFAPDESDRVRRRRTNSNNMELNNGHNHMLAALGYENPVLGVRKEIDVMDNRTGNINHCSCNELTKNIQNKESSFHVCERGTVPFGVTQIEAIKESDEGTKVENQTCLLHETETIEVDKKIFSLNAKIKGTKDQALSATVGWQAGRSASAGQNAVVADDDVSRHQVHQSQKKSEEKLDFEVEPDGSLPFYILDAHEEIYGANAGNLYLFGKVKAGGKYLSCCVVVQNLQRCVYAIPSVSFMLSNKIVELEKIVEARKDLLSSKITTANQGEDSEKCQISAQGSIDRPSKLEKEFEEAQKAFYTHLHELASELKKEISEKLLERKVSSFSMAPVKRKYAFERAEIPHGENYALKIHYPFKDPPLPSDLKGNNFCSLLGTRSSALELFLIKRKIKGPTWLSISKFSTCSASQCVSWCKFEVTIDFPKNIKVSTSSNCISKIPPVVVTAINFKTIANEKQHINEIICASVVCCHKAKIDTPMVTSEWANPSTLSRFTVLRPPEGGIFPVGFKTEAADKNATAGSNIIHECSERALLNRLMIELHKLDSDVLVGHNISGFDLDVFLHRVQTCRVPSTMWSKIGRLKRSTMPKLTKGSSVFGLGASAGIMSCISGRLLCDTYICSRDLLKEVSYSLTNLAKTKLNKDHKEVAPHDIPEMFQSSKSLMRLIEYGETDAHLSMELMFQLNILHLTYELTYLSGNLWQKTLQGARAQSVEYHLLHEFHANKFIVPDKFSGQSMEPRTAKRKNGNAVDSKVIGPDTNFGDMPPENNQRKTKRAPSYAGGLVLEPKKGLYDKYVLLLDFNSLYPSIIQEFNICFTTVERFSQDSVSCLPSVKMPGILPKLVKGLMDQRENTKESLKTASGLRAKQLDIKQRALKLTANSIYGCLGFSNSRFYAKPLAELITLRGREILQSTVNLVQNEPKLEVIYGDTDSIMIYTGLDDITEAKSKADKVIKKVNERYEFIKIGLDGLYKRMLLLKKKKYAAVKMQFKNGAYFEAIEPKGLDMVRRDWSLLSKELGDFCLSQILSGGSREDVVEVIHNSLMKVQEEMRNGQIPMEKYVISKMLTKAPKEYADARNQPHVEVALRMKSFSAGDVVPYIICCEQGRGLVTSVGIAQRARHPDELGKKNENWVIDIDYYLAQQIHPVISRLCASIEGTNPARLAECLGLDSTKFRNKSSASVNNDSSSLLLLDDEKRYRDCEPLVLSCPRCSETFECSPIISSVCAMINRKSADEQAGPTVDFWHRLYCPKCLDKGDEERISPASIANQVKRQAEGFISRYYKGQMTCDDEYCNYTTRSVNLRILGDSEKGTTCPNYPHCNGHLIRKYTEADLHRQLAYYCYILDTVRCIDKIEGDRRSLVEIELARIRPLVQTASTIVQKLRDRCTYGWVQLKDLVVV